VWASPLRPKNRAAYASLGHSGHPAGVRDQNGTLSAISVERCPPSRRNAVRHQSGTVSGMAWNTHIARAKRLTGGVRSAQTLGPHGHSAGQAQESRSKGPTVNKTPVPLVLCRLCSDDPNDDQRPLRGRMKTLVSPTGSSPANPSLRFRRTGPPALLRRVGGAFASQAHGTGPHTRAIAESSRASGRRIPGGPVCRRFAAHLGLRHQAVGA
jgi:hypothetical protein